MMMINRKKKCFNSVRKLTYIKLTDSHTPVYRTFSDHVGIEYYEIDWKKCNSVLSEKQAGIVKAYKSKDYNLVKKLQSELLQSFSARALAVRRTTTNAGKTTPGIDNVIWDSNEKKMKAILSLKNLSNYKAKPVRRVYIPKYDGSNRPLGIPTLFDRAVQTLWIYALDPIAEETSDARSYGFRKYRGVHDCSVYLKLVLGSVNNTRRFILDADVSKFFDSVSHDWLIENIPMEERFLKEFLKAGFLDKHQLHPTNEGFPQGGSISPIIARMVLDGLEKKLGKEFLVVRYADDFVVLGKSRNHLISSARPIIKKFLAERGLTLNERKTSIKYISDGFEYLGLQFREFPDESRAVGTKKGIFLVQPSKVKVAAYRKKLALIFKTHQHKPVGLLIKTLNETIRGWAEHYRAVSSTLVFNNLSKYIFTLTWKFLKKKYKNVSRRQIIKKHFAKVNNDKWVFCADPITDKPGVEKVYLIQLGNIRMKRHFLCTGGNPYSPEYYEYYAKRIARSYLTDPNPKSMRNRLYRMQKGSCPVCEQDLKLTEELEVHHVKPISNGGSNKLSNLKLLHKDCHKQVTHTKNKRLKAMFEAAGIIDLS